MKSQTKNAKLLERKENENISNNVNFFQLPAGIGALQEGNYLLIKTC